MRRQSRIKRRGCSACKAHRRNLVIQKKLSGPGPEDLEKPKAG